jgi:hypothetical protein
MKKLLCATAAFCLFAAPAFAATKIIFVGNSFTFGAHSSINHTFTDQVHDLNPPDELGRTVGGVPAIFKVFTKEAGLDYDVSLETVGGKGFDFHMTQKRDVINGKYDVVIAQGYSTLDEAHPGDTALLVKYTKEMSDMYAASNPNVKFYTVATWSRADKVYPDNAPAPWKGTPIAQMGKDVAVAYDKAKAASPHVTAVIPVGTAWNMAFDRGIADPNPYDDVGASKMNFWAYDGYHASAFGYYLYAAMAFGRVTGKDPMILAPKGKDHMAEDLGISPKQQQELLQLAHDSLVASGVQLAMNN